MCLSSFCDIKKVTEYSGFSFILWLSSEIIVQSNIRGKMYVTGIILIKISNPVGAAVKCGRIQFKSLYYNSVWSVGEKVSRERSEVGTCHF